MRAEADVSVPLTLAEAEAQNTNEPAAPSGSLVLYCLTLIAIPVIFLVAAAFVVPSTWFIRHSGNTYLSTMGYGAHLRGANCQVLVYGDSSALVGIDPAVITARTGLSACNISEFAGMVMVNGLLIPDTYLKNNARPKYMVFAFAPENLAEHKKWEIVTRFEAILFRFHEYPGLRTLLLMVQHPRDLFDYLETGARLAMGNIFHHVDPAMTHYREVRNGYMPVPGPPIQSCESVDRREFAPDPDWIAELKAKYSAGAVNVIVDATPEPECDPSAPFYRNRLGGVSDNGLQLLPAEDYNASGRLHMTRAGTVAFSGQVAQQILAAEARH